MGNSVKGIMPFHMALKGRLDRMCHHYALILSENEETNKQKQ
jgi:hypothetical protein